LAVKNLKALEDGNPTNNVSSTQNKDTEELSV
jgi:hypothetical protein